MPAFCVAHRADFQCRNRRFLTGRQQGMFGVQWDSEICGHPRLAAGSIFHRLRFVCAPSTRRSNVHNQGRFVAACGRGCFGALEREVPALSPERIGWCFRVRRRRRVFLELSWRRRAAPSPRRIDRCFGSRHVMKTRSYPPGSLLFVFASRVRRRRASSKTAGPPSQSVSLGDGLHDSCCSLLPLAEQE